MHSFEGHNVDNGSKEKCNIKQNIPDHSLDFLPREVFLEVGAVIVSHRAEPKGELKEPGEDKKQEHRDSLAALQHFNQSNVNCR